jgi:hypothetical protein
MDATTQDVGLAVSLGAVASPGPDHEAGVAVLEPGKLDRDRAKLRVGHVREIGHNISDEGLEVGVVTRLGIPGVESKIGGARVEIKALNCGNLSVWREGDSRTVLDRVPHVRRRLEPSKSRELSLGADHAQGD